jgi:hypothetical protein
MKGGSIMDKTNKELAVELAKYVVLASVLKNNDSIKKPLTGEDVQNILKDCYFAVCDLDKGM